MRNILFIIVIIVASFYVVGRTNSPARATFSKYMTTTTQVGFAAAKIMRDAPPEGLSRQQQDQIIALREQELAAAREVDIEALNQKVPGFGDKFRDLRIKSLEMIIHGYRTGNMQEFEQGQLLESQSNVWLRENLKALARW